MNHVIHIGRYVIEAGRGFVCWTVTSCDTVFLGGECPQRFVFIGRMAAVHGNAHFISSKNCNGLHRPKTSIIEIHPLVV